jgi:glycosyltransferase involved in cell wall biosynthesis
MSEKRFIYLKIGGFIGTLLRAQVVDLLQVLDEYGVTADFVTSVGLDRRIITRRHELVENKKALERAIKGKVYLLPIRVGPVSEKFIGLMGSATLLLILLKDMLTGKKIIIHARRHHSATIAIILKKIYKKVSVIFDIEGEGSAEYEYNVKQNGGDIHSKKVRRHIEYINRKEKETLLKSDYVLCISNVFKKHLIEKHNLKDINICAFPAYADSNKFYFDENRRREIRQQLGLEDNFVLVYSGNMNAYQMFPDMLKVFQIIKGIEERAHFLVLTIHREKAMEHISYSQLLENDYTLLGVDHDLMPAYLAAADLGLLFRERHLLNKVANPGKFAEYVMCGLPIMMTDEIGDYSEIMKTQELGIVIQSINDEEEIVEKFTRFRNLKEDIADRYRFGQWATSLFSKQNQLPKLLEIYQRISL